MAFDVKLLTSKFTEKILKNKFNSNQANCAKALKISPSYLCNVLKYPDRKIGPAFFAGLLYYCQQHGFKAMDFIEIDSPVKTSKPPVIKEIIFEHS